MDTQWDLASVVVIAIMWLFILAVLTIYARDEMRKMREKEKRERERKLRSEHYHFGRLREPRKNGYYGLR